MTNIEFGQFYPIETGTLPDTWVVAYVGDFAGIVQSGFACGQHGRDTGVAHLRPMNVSRDGKLDLSDIKTVPPDFNEKRLRQGDVLFNNTNSPELVGKTALVTERGNGLAFSNHMTQVQVINGISAKFMALQLHYLWSQKYFFHRCVKHVNQASISTTELANRIPFVCPSTNEQRRIVEKIEAMFDEIDKGVESLQTARATLGLYRQSLLKSAFEGCLTDDWRAQMADKLEAPAVLLARIQHERDARYKAALDAWQDALATWRAGGEKGKKPAKPKRPADLDTKSEITLGHVVLDVAQGWSPKCENHASPADDVWAVIKTTAIQAAKFLPQENKELPKSLQPREWLELKQGDVLITRAGPRTRVGVACMIKRTRPRLMLCDKAYRLNYLDSLVLPEFLEAYLNAPDTQRRIEVIKSGINDSGLNLKQEQLLALAFWLPSIAEQAEIVRRLDARLEAADALEAEIDAALARADALRQSILKKAFSGQLVPQDPGDEPAADLLARIKAERGKTDRPKRKKILA